MKKKVALLLAFALVFSFVCSGNTVWAASKKPKLNVKKLNMTVGGTFQIRVYNMKKKYKVTYVSSNVDVATVKADSSNKKRANISALSVGSSTITVTVKKAKKVVRTLKCKVKVSPSAVSIKFMKRQAKLDVGQKIRLETIIKPNTSMEQPVFESDDPDIATVNSRGLITGISPGTVIITATLLSCDITATCIITVLPEKPDDSAKFQKSNMANELEKK